MSDIERIPSMRKPSRQGVPKPKRRETGAPLHGGKTKDAPSIAPKVVAEPVVEPTHSEEPTLPEATLPEQPTLPTELAPASEPEPEPVAAAGAEPASSPEPGRALEPTTRATPAPELMPAPEVKTRPTPAPVAAPAPALAPASAAADGPPVTIRALAARVDAAWAVFRSAAFRLPAEYMNDHLTEDGWTRKQMLAHIAAWHDMTADRIVKLALTGRPSTIDHDTDAINAVAARVAIGKTAGEVLKDVEATFNRLRRQMLRLSDAQLRIADDWAAQIIAGNTYEHYAEHIADLTPPPSLPASEARS
jgi:hypothetical protein